MSLQFLYTGLSTCKGVCKLRFTNDSKRAEQLIKDGQTNVRIIKLPTAMNKLSAARFIGQLVEFQDQESQYVIQSFINSTTQTKSVPQQKIQAKIECEDLEDLPF